MKIVVGAGKIEREAIQAALDAVGKVASEIIIVGEGKEDMDWMKYNSYRSFGMRDMYDLRDTQVSSTDGMRSFGMKYTTPNKAKNKRRKNKRRK